MRNPEDEDRYGRLRLSAGVLGRAVLAFVCGCLVVTLLPLVLGWHPYVVKSGSMEPNLKVGDVILASPERDPTVLLGRVTVFDDPQYPGHVKSHRIVAVNSDGTLTSKGDANPTADPVHVRIDQVDGIGRLLVRWVGLPLVWLMNRQWLPLLGFIILLALAISAVTWDHEEPDEELDQSDVVPAGSDGPGAVPATSHRAPYQFERLPRIAITGVGAVISAAALLIPSASAAFSATTRTTSSSWTAPHLSYTTEMKSAGPYLYWKLDDTGSTANDASPNGHDGSYAGGITHSVSGATPDDTASKGITQTSASSCITTPGGNILNPVSISPPSTFTEIVWFKAAPGYANGGKLIGFDDAQTGVDVLAGNNYDRMIYLDGAGVLWFGINAGGTRRALRSAATYLDGAWHMAAATLGPAGTALYVDGHQVDSNATTSSSSYLGYWRVGCGNIAGWGNFWTGPNGPALLGTLVGKNIPFGGSLDEAAVVNNTALSPVQIADLYYAR